MMGVLRPDHLTFGTSRGELTELLHLRVGLGARITFGRVNFDRFALSWAFGCKKGVTISY